MCEFPLEEYRARITALTGRMRAALVNLQPQAVACPTPGLVPGAKTLFLDHLIHFGRCLPLLCGGSLPAGRGWDAPADR